MLCTAVYAISRCPTRSSPCHETSEWCGLQRTGATGLEPATSGVTGRRSNQLNYAPGSRRSVAAACAGATVGAVTRVDWIALVIAALTALSGLKRGLVATAFSLAGLAAGAVLGARLAPHFLHNGSASPYTPLAALIGAAVGAALLQSVASLAGS